jgi:hypothetical protein
MRKRKRMLRELDQDIRDHLEVEIQDNMERGMVNPDYHVLAYALLVYPVHGDCIWTGSGFAGLSTRSEYRDEGRLRIGNYPQKEWPVFA